jgi:ubiquinone/menaquinone biosynthesis C-methylase UbiE
MSSAQELSIPQYLREHYWWAYVHPRAMRVWDRTWLTNLILYGNFSRLRDLTLGAMGDLSGRTLQIACCYGDLTPRLAARAAAQGGALDVIDIVPEQLAALRRKLSPEAAAATRLMRMDAAALGVPDATYDRVLVFFLFHEQPADVRRRTLSEALRVVKPHGTVVICDFARPTRWNPIRLWLPLLGILEPFAHDLWARELNDLMPEEMAQRQWTRTTYFGGLFQLLVGTRI